MEKYGKLKSQICQKFLLQLLNLPHEYVIQGLRSYILIFAQESIPAALTKDKKRIEGTEVNVHLAWRSTLYVTNFPEKTDDSAIRDLFGQVRLPGLSFPH